MAERAISSQYDEVYERFEWQEAWDQFEGERDGQFNVGYEVLGKHVENGMAETMAIRIVDVDTGAVEELTYGDLDRRVGQFVTYLSERGLSPGDRVAGMLEPRPELYATALGCWCGGFQYVPLFSLFGPEAVNYRLDDADVKAIVTSSAHVEKIDPGTAESLEYVLLVDGDAGAVDGAGELARPFDAIGQCDADYDVADTEPDDVCTIQYTSGTTGPPKGVKARHAGLVNLYPAFRWAADQRPEHRYFSTAPPAWSYGLFGSTAYPLHVGMGTTAYRGQITPEAVVDVLQEYDVTNFFAPPTLLRQLIGSDLDFDAVDHALEVVVTAGEPLDPQTVTWVQDTLGTKIVDHYGFTEMGMIVNNYVFDDWEVKPGSMGKPCPGFEVRVFDLEEDRELPQGEVGEIAVRTDAFPGIRGYLNRPEKTEEMWGREWVRSGDLGRVDEDGYFWFEGRADDVILSAGYRIGPTEVENSVMNHEAVAEVAVAGLPDDERGEVVAAFVRPVEDVTPSDDLAEEISDHVREDLSKHEYPRQIHFVEEFPRTASGKVKRFELRDEYA